MFRAFSLTVFLAALVFSLGCNEQHDYELPGRLDEHFGTGGFVVSHGAAGGSGTDVGEAVAVDSSGRILVTGYSENASGNNDMTIWRYNADGSLDTTFDTDGIVTHHDAAAGNGADAGDAIVLDASGQILVTGRSVNASGDDDMVIWRYNPDGTLDTTFDTDGFAVFNDAAGGNLIDQGASIALDSNGRILVAGESWNGTNMDIAVWVCATDGSLDPAFDTDGILTKDNVAGGNAIDQGLAIIADSSDRILVAGYSDSATGRSDMVLFRFNADGLADTAFDSDGEVLYHDASGTISYCGYGIAIDAGGRIFVAGSGGNATVSDMALWCYNTDGTLDTDFNGDGLATHRGVYGSDRATGAGVAMASKGRILVVGACNNPPDWDMTVWRWESDGDINRVFNRQGYAAHNSAAGGNGHDYGNAVATDTKGRVIVVGSSTNATPDLDMVVWRYYP